MYGVPYYGSTVYSGGGTGSKTKHLIQDVISFSIECVRMVNTYISVLGRASNTVLSLLRSSSVLNKGSRSTDSVNKEERSVSTLNNVSRASNTITSGRRRISDRIECND